VAFSEEVHAQKTARQANVQNRLKETNFMGVEKIIQQVTNPTRKQVLFCKIVTFTLANSPKVPICEACPNFAKNRKLAKTAYMMLNRGILGSARYYFYTDAKSEHGIALDSANIRLFQKTEIPLIGAFIWFMESTNARSQTSGICVTVCV
jgi:hypothetical protein